LRSTQKPEPAKHAIVRLARISCGHKAILLGIFAVDLRLPIVLGDDLVKPILEPLDRLKREVELSNDQLPFVSS